MRELLAFKIKLDKDSKIKMLLGILLAVVCIFCWQKWFPGSASSMLMSVCFGSVFLAAGCLKIQANTDRAARFLNVLWGICGILVVIIAALPSDYSAAGLYRTGLNLLCAFIVAAFFLTVTGSWRIAANLTICALTLLIGLNLIVFMFRGKELSIGDFRAAKTALSVVGQYKFRMTKRILMLCSFFVLALFSQCALPAFPKKRGSALRRRIVPLLGTVALILVLNFGAAKEAVTSWSFDGTTVNGYLLNFYLGVRDAFIKAPDGYSPEIVQAYAEAHKPEEKQTQDLPNILVIMDESFSDFRIYGKDFTTDVPVTPFIDSLSENVVKGYALTSIHGGQTPNAEFEFLTGNSMGFLPSGSVPYQQYISETHFSIAHLLDDYGYYSFATHPYHASGWSRSTVYPHLGLGNYSFLKDYPKEKLLRTYVSDQEMFEYVLDCLDEDRDGKPLFLMGITMQNHGGYLYEGADFTETVHLEEGFRRDYPEADQYLSLMNETDRAVEYLLGQLQNYPEDTIVVFFGDHQPNLGTGFTEELNGGALNTLDEKMRLYTVPFFIWANYDIEEAVVPCTSLNYLSRYLLECAGLELPAYYRILKDIEETIPAINALGYYSPEKGRYATFDEAEGKEAEMLEMYENVQYNNLFDKKNRNYELFGQYLTP